MNTQKIDDIKLAILRGDKKYNNITLPSPQTSGTDGQKNAYALQQATKIYNQLVSNLNLAKAKLAQAKETCISSYIDEASRELDAANEALE